MKKRLLIMFAVMLILAGHSLAHGSTWALTLGGTGSDYAQSVRQMTDGGFMVVGYTNSSGAGDNDAWVLRLNADGSIGWQKTYGGTGDDRLSSVQQTSGGAYIVAGYTNSFGTNGYDAWVMKLNADGSVAWQKTYYMGSSASSPSIQQTGDGGYIVNYVTFVDGKLDILLLKLNTDGSVSWRKTYGRGDSDYSQAVQQTSEGGYIVAGYSISFDNDAVVLKLTEDGSVSWVKTYSGTGDDRANSIQQTADGGYIVAGYVGGGTDAWVLKLNADGGVAWQKTYGGTSSAYYARSVRQRSGGGYIVAGYTISSGAGGNGDAWVLELNADGDVIWQKSYGGSGHDYAYDIRQTSDGGYTVAGRTESFGRGGGDAWVVSLDQNGAIAGCSRTTASSAVTQSGTGTASSQTITPASSTAAPNTPAASVGDTAVTPGVVCSGSSFPLETALDNTSLSFIVDSFPWTGVLDFSSLGGSAAQSGSISHDGVSAITASVQGPGQLSFQWRVSSELNYDFIRFYIDAAEQTKISGTTAWATVTSSIPAGTHTLRWSYTKDDTTVVGYDAGWVDNVQFVPDGLPGDINKDNLIDLHDAISALLIAAGQHPPGTIDLKADVNGDQKIGTEEALYILREVGQ